MWSISLEESAIFNSHFLHKRAKLADLEKQHLQSNHACLPKLREFPCRYHTEEPSIKVSSINMNHSSGIQPFHWTIFRLQEHSCRRAKPSSIIGTLVKTFNWRPGDLTVRQGKFAGQRIFRWNLCGGTELGRRRCNTKIYSLLYVSLQVDRWNIFFMTIIGPKNNNWKLCIPNFPRVCNKTFCGGPWTTYKQSFWSL